MKKILNIWLLLISLTVFSQSPLSSTLFHSTFEQSAFSTMDPLQIMLAANPTVDYNKYNQYLSDFNTHLEKLRKKTDQSSSQQTLEKIFYFNHRRKLNWYNNNVIFSDLFDNGRYDCLTGTAFYAATLNSLNITYDIYEFNYHVFLVAYCDEGPVLIEPTDPLEGFVTDLKEIEKRIDSFGHSEGMTANLEGVSNIITLNDLAGLQYYNLGIQSFNEGQYDQAFTYIQKANFLYPSKRIKEIHRLFKSQVRLVTSTSY